MSGMLGEVMFDDAELRGEVVVELMAAALVLSLRRCCAERFQLNEGTLSCTAAFFSLFQNCALPATG